MQIRTAFLPQLAEDPQGSVSIVIDVLRATTVIATLFDRGCPRVYATASHDAARRVAKERGLAILGETHGLREPDFDYGNSPTELAALDFTNRPVVISTSNGTRAIAAAAASRALFVGALVNRKAVAEAAWTAATAIECDILLVCSGTGGRYTLEDATTAGLYVESLVAFGRPWTMPQLDDASVTARRLWQNEPNILRGWMEGSHARHLADIGFGDDLAACAAVDTIKCVPTLVDDTEAANVAAPVILVR